MPFFFFRWNSSNQLQNFSALLDPKKEFPSPFLSARSARKKFHHFPLESSYFYRTSRPFWPSSSGCERLCDLCAYQLICIWQLTLTRRVQGQKWPTCYMTGLGYKKKILTRRSSNLVHYLSPPAGNNEWSLKFLSLYNAGCICEGMSKLARLLITRSRLIGSCNYSWQVLNLLQFNGKMPAKRIRFNLLQVRPLR